MLLQLSRAYAAIFDLTAAARQQKQIRIVHEIPGCTYQVSYSYNALQFVGMAVGAF